jgi:hypothetical protein
MAVDGFNYSGFGSPELPLTTGEFCLSTQEPEVSVAEFSTEGLKAFPNPSNGTVSLQAISPILEVSIYDVSGTCIRTFVGTGDFSDSNIQLPQEAGFYFIRVKTKRGYGTTRIIRN